MQHVRHIWPWLPGDRYLENNEFYFMSCPSVHILAPCRSQMEIYSMWPGAWICFEWVWGVLSHPFFKMNAVFWSQQTAESFVYALTCVWQSQSPCQRNDLTGGQITASMNTLPSPLHLEMWGLPTPLPARQDFCLPFPKPRPSMWLFYVLFCLIVTI